MSFILDQLKKSGKKRELELAMRSTASPGGSDTSVESSIPDTAKPVSQYPHRYLYLLLLCISVISLSIAGGYFLLRRQPAGPAISAISDSGPGAQPHTIQPYTPPAINPGPGAIGLRKPDAPVAIKTAPVPTVPPVNNAERTGASSAGSNNPSNAEVFSIIPSDTSGGPHKTPDKEDPEKAPVAPSAQASEQPHDFSKVPELNQLPPSVRNSLPAIHITSHLYRNNSRLVSINGSIMSEGISMEGGLLLEKITPEGVILSFRGHRFRVRAN